MASCKQPTTLFDPFGLLDEWRQWGLMMDAAREIGKIDEDRWTSALEHEAMVAGRFNEDPAIARAEGRAVRGPLLVGATIR